MVSTPARDLARLRDIIAACERVAEYTLGNAESLNDARTMDAVLHCLTVIGEAVGALSDATYVKLASLPTGTPVAMRNLIVHEYWRVDSLVVWNTVAHDLPALLEETAALLLDTN